MVKGVIKVERLMGLVMRLRKQAQEMRNCEPHQARGTGFTPSELKMQGAGMDHAAYLIERLARGDDR